jgi:hypothetical protein
MTTKLVPGARRVMPPCAFTGRSKDLRYDCCHESGRTEVLRYVFLSE